jgi:hypothetical protein
MSHHLNFWLFQISSRIVHLLRACLFVLLLLKKQLFEWWLLDAAFVVAASVKATHVCLPCFWMCCQLAFELKGAKNV